MGESPVVLGEVKSALIITKILKNFAVLLDNEIDKLFTLKYASYF